MFSSCCLTVGGQGRAGEDRGIEIREGWQGNIFFFLQAIILLDPPSCFHPPQCLPNLLLQSPSPGRSELQLSRPKKTQTPTNSLDWGCNSHVWSLQINSGTKLFVIESLPPGTWCRIYFFYSLTLFYVPKMYVFLHLRRVFYCLLVSLFLGIPDIFSCRP